jgi:hypothetical protein
MLTKSRGGYRQKNYIAVLTPFLIYVFIHIYITQTHAMHDSQPSVRNGRRNLIVIDNITNIKCSNNPYIYGKKSYKNTKLASGPYRKN